MVKMGYNYSSTNHTKSDGLLAQHRHLLSTDVRGIDTMSHSIPNSTEQSNIPYGYCHCGCGQETTIVRVPDKRHGRVKGEPHLFIRGHNGRGMRRDSIVTTDDSDWREIALTQGQVAIVDAADYEWLSSFNWFANKAYDGWYASRKVWSPQERTTLMMHRVIMCPADGQEVDHINGDKLDNRRANLRLATRTQNGRNRRKPKNNKSGYKGVHKARQRWRARIKYEGKQVSLGTYDTPEEAATAYDAAAIRFYGEFALLNEVGRELKIEDAKQQAQDKR